MSSETVLRQFTVTGSAGTGKSLGSRKESQRYSHSSKSRAGFVELGPAHMMNADQLFQALKRVPGVRHVAWNRSKSCRGTLEITRRKATAWSNHCKATRSGLSSLR